MCDLGPLKKRKSQKRAQIGQIQQFSIVNTKEYTHKARGKRADNRGNLSENIEEHIHKTKNAKNLRKTASELNGSEKN